VFGGGIAAFGGGEDRGDRDAGGGVFGGGIAAFGGGQLAEPEARGAVLRAT